MFLKKLLIFCVVHILIIQTFAQQKKIDELELSLQNLTNKQKAEVYNQLAEYYKNISLEKSYKNSKLALEYGEKYNDVKQTLKAKLNIGEYYLDQGNYNKAKKSFLAVLKTKNYRDKTIKAAALNKIGVVYYFQSQDSIAMKYLKKSLNIYKTIGKQYWREKAQVLNLISYIHNREGNFSEALEFHFQALNTRKKLGDKNEIAKSYSSIGLFYVNQGDYSSAMTYYKKSLEISKEIGNRKGEAISLNNIATIYVKQGFCKKAEKLHQEALSIKKDLNIQKEIALSYKNIGKLYVCQNDYEEALDNFSKACKLNDKLGNHIEVTDIYLLIAQAYFNQKDYQSAISSYQKAEKHALRSNALILLNQTYEGLYNTYLLLENSALFMKYYQKSQDLKDNKHIQSINSTEVQRMRRKYEQAEKIRESKILAHQNEVLEKEKELRLMNIQQKNIYLTFLIAGLIALCMITLLIYVQFRTRQKANQHLRKANDTMKELNQRLLASEEDLKKSNELKTKLLSMISHDVRTPITSLNALMALLANDVEALDKKQLKNIIQQLNIKTNNVLDFLDDLLKWTTNQSENMELVPEKVQLLDLAHKIYDIVLPRLENKRLNLHIIIPPKLTVFTDKNVLKTVLLNLVANAIKFTPDCGAIKVQARKTRSQVKLMVCDTGIGISEENLQKIFNPDIYFTTRGTKQEKGSGLGLNLCKEFVELLGGNIWAESKLGQGSRFFFTVPSMVEVPEKELKSI